MTKNIKKCVSLLKKLRWVGCTNIITQTIGEVLLMTSIKKQILQFILIRYYSVDEQHINR